MPAGSCPPADAPAAQCMHACVQAVAALAKEKAEKGELMNMCNLLLNQAEDSKKP